MAVTSMTKSKVAFTLVLTNKHTRSTKKIKYSLANNIVADKWFKAMKHLRKVEPHALDSNLKQPRPIGVVYKEFCEAAGIKEIEYKQVTQDVLNIMHDQFIAQADIMSRNQSKDVLYEFHQAIHKTESKMDDTAHWKWTKMHIIAYSYKAGLFEEEFPCNKFYSDELERGNIYLLFSQSGKKPYNYFFDSEPADFDKVKQIMKAHHTFIPNWFVCLEDRVPRTLPLEFEKFFEPYRSWFLKKYGLQKWDAVDEQSGVLLAKPDKAKNVHQLIAQGGYTYSHIEL